jgi:hypothetical protein
MRYILYIALEIAYLRNRGCILEIILKYVVYSYLMILSKYFCYTVVDRRINTLLDDMIAISVVSDVGHPLVVLVEGGDVFGEARNDHVRGTVCEIVDTLAIDGFKRVQHYNQNRLMEIWMRYLTKIIRPQPRKYQYSSILCPSVSIV